MLIKHCSPLACNIRNYFILVVPLYLVPAECITLISFTNSSGHTLNIFNSLGFYASCFSHLDKNNKICNWQTHSHSKCVLRAIACKYTTGRKIFLCCVKRTLLVNYFQKYTLKVQASSYFCEIQESSKYRSINQNDRRNLRKLHIFNRPVQKEGNLPRFLIHAVCNLNFILSFF